MSVHTAVLAVVALILSGWTGESRTVQAIPSAYNPGKAPVSIRAAWIRDLAAVAGPSDHRLTLEISDTVRYPPGASAIAVVTPFEAQKLTHLAFDHQIGTYCTNGSPRWDVETTDGSVYAFGCASGVHQVDLPATGWERITFSCTDAGVLTGFPGSCPLGSGQTVSVLQIVQDEAGSTTLANLDVNWVVMSGPGNNP